MTQPLEATPIAEAQPNLETRRERSLQLALAAARTSPGVLPIETRLTALQLAAVFIGFTVSTLAAVSDEQKAASAALRREVEHRRRAEEALRKSEERAEMDAYLARERDSGKFSFADVMPEAEKSKE